MADISKIQIAENTLNIKDNNAIENITRNGTTFTATKRDGTSFTFDAPPQEQADWNETDSTKEAYIKNKPSDLVIDSNYVHTDNNYSNEEKTKLSNAYNTAVSTINELGAKNLLKYPYYQSTVTLSGVTFKVNNDGTIETSGTATATNSYSLHTRLEGEVNDFILKNGTYILSGCPSGGSSSTFEMAVLNTYNSVYRYLGRDYGDGVEFVVNGDDFSTEQSNLQVQITVRNGANMSGLVFKPMIRLASISDNTFVPYSETNRQLTNSKMSWQQQNILGAKNLLKYPYYQDSVINNGVTFTAHSDGTITTSGTASASATANFVLHTRIEGEINDFVLKNGRYLVNGCASGGASNKWYIGYQYTNKSNQFAVLANDYGDGDTELILNGDYFSDDEVNLQVVVSIARGVNADGLVFKPMIRLASIADSTFEPYAQTNVELTAEKMDVENIAPIEKGNSASKAYAVGDYMIWKRRFYKVTASISSGGAITEETNVTRTTIGAELKAVLNA